MNHNTARCSSCNTICVLPHLRARASAAKCEACARREAERVREQCARSIFDVVPPLPTAAYRGPSDLFGNHGAYGNPRECFQRISHASYRRIDDMVEVSFMGELGHAKNTLSVPGAFVRTCFGEGYDVGRLVGGEVRYDGVTGKVTGLSAGPDKRELTAVTTRRVGRACSVCFVYFAADNCEMCASCWTAWTTPSLYTG